MLDQNLDNHAFIGLVSVIMMILRAHKAPNPAPILWGRYFFVVVFDFLFVKKILYVFDVRVNSDVGASLKIVEI